MQHHRTRRRRVFLFERGIVAEPTITTGATVLTFTTIAAAGSAFGLEYTLLGFGFFAAMFRLTEEANNNTGDQKDKPMRSKTRAFFAVVFSTLFAAASAPVLAAYLVSGSESLNGVAEVLKIALALGLGYAWQVVIQSVVDVVKQRFGLGA